MCGITGFWSYDNRARPPLRSRLHQMSTAISKRGPDADGHWYSADGRLQLAHRRLSILDLSDSGNQPMTDPRSGCVLVFNGEIYNYRQLRQELTRAGNEFRSESDTEVLLKGYVHWGEGVLGRLRGMFAFALWDARSHVLLLARDPYGIKPLNFVDQHGCLAFCSQVRPLRDFVLTDRQPDPAGVVGFLLLGSVPEPHTLYRAIRTVPAGHLIRISARGVSDAVPHGSIALTWQSAAQRPELLDADALKDRVRSAVRESVTAHQVADVPVGAFLSAGIDSGALVGLMTEDSETELQTVTLGFDEFRDTPHEEAALAAEVAAHYGTRHRTVWIGDNEAEASLPQMLADMDQPSVDGFNTWLVSKHAAALGLKVVVSGVGGDELFGGYSHFSRLPCWRQRLRRLAAVPGALPLAALAARLLQQVGVVHVKAEGLARLGPELAGLYLVRRGLFMPWDLPALVDGDLLREGLAALQPPRFLLESVGELPKQDYAAIAALEATSYLRNQLLRDSDWASMAHSVELRTPLVDYQLLRELAPVLVTRPAGMEGKVPLAMAPQSALPDAVLNRRKSGFALPMARWLERSMVLDEWRGEESLRRSGTPWARRMAFALLARHLS